LGRLTQRSRMMEYDQPLVWVALALMMLGLVMVYSASIALPDSPKYAGYASTHFLFRQATYICIALVCAAIAFRIPVKIWQTLAPWLFVATLILLLLVLIPGIGKGVNGARRW